MGLDIDLAVMLRVNNILLSTSHSVYLQPVMLGRMKNLKQQLSLMHCAIESFELIL